MPMPTALTQATDFFIPGRNLSTDARGRRLFHDARGTAHCLRGQGAERALRRQSARTVLAATGWMVSLYLGIFLAGLGPEGLQDVWRFLSGMAGADAATQASALGPAALMVAWVATLGCFVRGLLQAGLDQRTLLRLATAPPKPATAQLHAPKAPARADRDRPERGGVYQQGFHAWMLLLAAMGAVCTDGAVSDNLLGVSLCVLLLMGIGQSAVLLEGQKQPARA